MRKPRRLLGPAPCTALVLAALALSSAHSLPAAPALPAAPTALATDGAAAEGNASPVRLESPVSAPPGKVRLAGANGREVDFAGIWEARPEGLLVVTDADSAPALVAWDRFDLERLRTEQPAIDAARQRARFLRSPQPINLGLFAGILTPAQAGAELRRALDETITIKVPLRYRTTTETSTRTAIIPPRPIIYNGILLPPPPGLQPVVSQTNRTVSETRFSPDDLTTSPRRVLDILSRTDGIAAQERRELFELVKANPVLLENLAASLDRVAASLPPRHLLPSDPTVLTLALRLQEFSNGLRKLTTALVLDHADQMLVRDLIYLTDSPNLR
jgi:hypothetical protein